MESEYKIVPQQIKGLKITKFPVNYNIATTVHYTAKKQHIIIGTWNYRCRNWVCVILSRVKTLSGLLLTNQLNDDLVKLLIRQKVRWLR